MKMGDETELTTILEGIGEGFYAVDRDWRITRFNTEASHHFKRPASEMLGRVLWKVFPNAVDTDLGRTFFSTMASRATELQGEVRIDYRPDGVVCTIDAPLDSIHDGDKA